LNFLIQIKARLTGVATSFANDEPRSSMQGQSRAREALTLLKAIYDQFTEGFGTPELIRAKALLEADRAI
jgi:hypothetical protein